LLYENPMTKTTGQAVSELLRAAAGKLDAYRRSVGTVMAAIYLDLLTPLYAQYPEIDPEKA
jgi:hypothetical protein